MKTIRIKLLRSDYIRDLLINRDTLTEGAQRFLDEGKYLTLPVIQNTCASEMSNEECAEEMFDLTNNPSRQDEREAIYGNSRSLSVGDVVEVDGVNLVCCSIGWVELAPAVA